MFNNESVRNTGPVPTAVSTALSHAVAAIIASARQAFKAGDFAEGNRCIRDAGRVTDVLVRRNAAERDARRRAALAEHRHTLPETRRAFELAVHAGLDVDVLTPAELVAVHGMISDEPVWLRRVQP